MDKLQSSIIEKYFNELKSQNEMIHQKIDQI